MTMYSPFHRHKTSFYKEGWQQIEFCTICGAEGLELLEECKIDDRQRIAQLLGFACYEDCDIKFIIADLISLEKREGTDRLHEEITKLNKNELTSQRNILK